MIKTYITGIAIGITGAIAAFGYIPAVDLAREVSIVSVAPNGGNSETFYVNVPGDRIMLGAQEQTNLMPPDLRWPEDPVFAGVRTELFKVRNSRDAVIGVGSRMVVRNEKLGDVIEWAVHLPARGSLYVRLAPENQSGRRTGRLRAGTREFDNLGGGMSERWVPNGTGADPASQGRIEMVATYIADASPETTGEQP